MCTYVYNLFYKALEGAEIGVDLIEECGCLEIYEYVEPRIYIVQNGKVYRVGEEE
jgi:hypothetical protein